MSEWSHNDDCGLPDEAFTEDELAAGVQHIARTGDPNATSSEKMTVHRRQHSTVAKDHRRAEWTDQVKHPRTSTPLRFETFAKARDWAQNNPGATFRRATDGQGFESKPTQNHQEVEVGDYHARSAEIKALSPHLHTVLSKSGTAGNGFVIMRPFYKKTWQDQLGCLSPAQRKRLHLVVTSHLKSSVEELRILEDYIQTRRDTKRKAGNYGEELSRRINEVMVGPIADIAQTMAVKPRR